MNPRIYVLTLVTFAFGSGAFIFAGLLESLAADLGVTTAVAGQLQTVFVLTSAVLGPVALANWYGERRAGIGIAPISCVLWYGTQFASGFPYSHPLIPVWNALIRFGFFFVTSSLLMALRGSLVEQRHLARTDVLTGLCSRRAF